MSLSYNLQVCHFFDHFHTLATFSSDLMSKTSFFALLVSEPLECRASVCIHGTSRQCARRRHAGGLSQ